MTGLKKPSAYATRTRKGAAASWMTGPPRASRKRMPGISVGAPGSFGERIQNGFFTRDFLTKFSAIL